MIPKIANTNWHTVNQNNKVKEAQKFFKENPQYDLSQKIFISAIDSEMTGKPIIERLSDEVIEYAEKNKDSIGVISFMMNNCNKYVYQIKSEEDFVKAYISNEEIIKIWIVIKDACFKNNKKYLQKARKFKEEFNIEFELTIFNESQISEMKEELKFHNFKEIKK